MGNGVAREGLREMEFFYQQLSFQALDVQGVTLPIPELLSCLAGTLYV